jgi:hypothetical protein
MARKDLIGVKHVSYSQIDKWRRCPRSWEYSYVKGIWGPATPNLIVGSAYHDTLEKCFKFRINNDEHIDSDILEELMQDSWDKQTVSRDINWQGQDKDTLFNVFTALAREYVETTLHLITPSEVEQELQIPLSDGTLFILRYDLRDINGIVYDHKTANPGAVSLSYSQNNINKHLQPTATAFALNEEIEFCYHLAVKYARPKIRTMNTHRTKNDIEYFKLALEQTVKAMNSGICPPNEDGWWCDPLYCENYSDCRPGLGKKYTVLE